MSGVRMNISSRVYEITLRSSVVFFLIGILGWSCIRAEKYSVGPVHPLEEKDFYGCWMLDSNSLGKLPSLGFDNHRDALSHVIKLNSNGTCVYRAATSYPDFSQDPQRHTREYEDFFMEGAKHGIPYESWYIWLAIEDNLRAQLSGPFDSRPSSSVGVVCKNKWPRWRLVDWSRLDGLKRSNMGERYSVQFYIHQDDPPKMGNHWTVRAVGSGICLVKWAGHARDTVMLQKVDSESGYPEAALLGNRGRVLTNSSPVNPERE